MKKIRQTRTTKKGFTIIEVALFVAVSGFILVGIIIGTGTSLFRQRYNDSVQNFAEFLRTVYAQVSAVQNAGSGQSGQAIYGKLVTFGEKGNDTIYTYDVVGAAVSGDKTASYSTIGALQNVVGANVVKVEKSGSFWRASSINQNDYSPLWQARIETPDHEYFTGSILIVRSPVSGTIHTFYSSSVVKVQETIEKITGVSEHENPLFGVLPSFADQQLDFCVASEDQTNAIRRNIRINQGAHNASAITLIDQDNETENKCVSGK